MWILLLALVTSNVTTYEVTYWTIKTEKKEFRYQTTARSFSGEMRLLGCNTQVNKKGAIWEVKYNCLLKRKREYLIKSWAVDFQKRLNWLGFHTQMRENPTAHAKNSHAQSRMYWASPS